MTYQLELWCGREYQCVAGLNATSPAELRGIAEFAKAKAWRIVRADKNRPARPKRWREHVSRAPHRSRGQVCADYLAWARAAGLERVTVYSGLDLGVIDCQHPTRGGETYAVAVADQLCDFRFLVVDPADFLGPPPKPELDP